MARRYSLDPSLYLDRNRMPALRHIAYHIGSPGSGPGDPLRLFEKHPNVQRAAFGVADHYLSELGQVDLGGASKVIFEVRENASKLDEANLSKMMSVYKLLVPLELEQADKLKGNELRLFLLESLHCWMLWLAKHFGSSPSPYVDAYQGVKRDSAPYGFFAQRGKSWKSPKSSKKCRIFVEYDCDSYRVFADVYEGRKLVGHIHLHSTVPVENPLPSLVREVKWTARDQVKLETIDFDTGDRVKVAISVDKLKPGSAADRSRLG